MTSLADRLKRISGLSGYVKPPVHEGLRMDSNENMALNERVQNKVLDTARRRVDPRQYPVEGAERVAGALASYLNVPVRRISVGNGSDQILDMILQGLTRRGERVLVTDPTFSFFLDRCALHGLELIRVPYGNDMTVSVDDILAESGDADLIYLDSPNNPTGYQIPRDGLRRLAKSFGGPIIVDEAYAEFADYSAHTLLAEHPHMMVVRTLSKSFGMAGMRVGYMVSDPAVADAFNRVIQYPYPISSVSAEAAVEALKNADKFSPSWDTVRKERARIAAELQKHGKFRIFGSSANFVLFDAGGSCHRTYEALAEQGIYVRLLGSVGKADGCIRVGVGSKAMNSRFLTAVRDLLK